MSNIIFTCIVDSYDTLNEIKLEEGWRAICFSNTDIQSNSWKIVKIEKTEKIHREIKICPYKFLPEHEKSVWVDGNIIPKISLTEFVKDKEGFWLMAHPDRDCVYEEGKRCIELGKDKPELIELYLSQLRTEGYPAHNGLAATGVIVRNNTEDNVYFGNMWWNIVRKWSNRDQLSFPYIAHKLSLNYKMFPFLEGFEYTYHIHRIKEQEEKRKLRLLNKSSRRKGGVTKEYLKRYGLLP